MSIGDVEGALRRSRAYWNRDGIPELAVGLLFAAIAALFAAEAALGDRGRSVSAIGLPIVVGIGAFALRPLVRAAKDRLVHSRTGWVSFPKPSRARRAVAVAVGLSVAGIVAVAVHRLGSWELPIETLGTGVLVGAGFLFLGVRYGLPRLALVGLGSIAAGSAVVLAGLPNPLASAVYFGATALALLVSGGATLRAWLAAHLAPR